MSPLSRKEAPIPYCTIVWLVNEAVKAGLRRAQNPGAALTARFTSQKSFSLDKREWEPLDWPRCDISIELRGVTFLTSYNTAFWRECSSPRNRVRILPNRQLGGQQGREAERPHANEAGRRRFLKEGAALARLGLAGLAVVGWLALKFLFQPVKRRTRI